VEESILPPLTNMIIASFFLFQVLLDRKQKEVIELESLNALLEGSGEVASSAAPPSAAGHHKHHHDDFLPNGHHH
jgi:hypothetical protein